MDEKDTACMYSHITLCSMYESFTGREDAYFGMYNRKISFESLKLMMSFVSVLRDIPAEKANHKKLFCKFKLIKIP